LERNEIGNRKEVQARGIYTLEFKMEAVRLVQGGQASSVTVKVLGIPKQTLDNWVRLSKKGQLKGAGDNPRNGS
jgi:transposase